MDQLSYTAVGLTIKALSLWGEQRLKTNNHDDILKQNDVNTCTLEVLATVFLGWEAKDSVMECMPCRNGLINLCLLPSVFSHIGP